MKKYCIDCNIEITNQALRCHSCANLNNAQVRDYKGKNNPNYKIGSYIKLYFCNTCGKPISRTNGLKGKQHCNSCANKGENNPFYKNGKPHCIDCSKELYNYTSKRCEECSILFQLQGTPENHPRYNTHHTEETKEKIGIKAKERLKDPTKHPMWQGGLSRLPYPIGFNNKLKESIRNRDDHKCQKCNTPEKKNKQLLDIHHIDYNKNNIEPENLVSVCHKCNSKVNANRDYWFAYFTYNIKEIYGKCTCSSN